MPSTQLPRLKTFVERRMTARSRDTSAKPAHVHRERDFGVGYGNSSGYVSNPSYIVPGRAFFRCR